MSVEGYDSYITIRAIRPDMSKRTRAARRLWRRSKRSFYLIKWEAMVSRMTGKEFNVVEAAEKYGIELVRGRWGPWA